MNVVYGFAEVLGAVIGAVIRVLGGASKVGESLILGGITIAAFGALVGIVGGLTRRDAMYRWVRWAAAGFFACMLAANGVMEFALLTHDFSVSYVAQVGSRATPTVFTIVSLWSALEGSILFWGLILGSFILAFALAHRKDPARFVTIATGVMLAVGVFFAFLIAGPANPFLPTPGQVPLDGPGPNPLLQNHILMVIHPPMLYLGYVGLTVPFGLAVAGLLSGEMGVSWMGPLRRWTMLAWIFLTIGIILGAWWAYAVLGWGGYWAWDPVENASFLPWLTATAFVHSTMVQERKQMLKVWTLALALVSFWLTLLGTFMTRSGVFNSVHSFTQSDIGPTFLVFLGIVALVSILLLGLRGHLLVSDGEFKSLASREFAILVNNVVFALFTFMVLSGTVYPLLKEGLFNERISVGEPYFNFFSIPFGIVILLLMGVGPALPWGRADGAKTMKLLLVPSVVGAVVFVASVAIIGFGNIREVSNLWAPITFGLAGFVTVVTLHEMFLPAYVRMKEKKEGAATAVWQSATRARRRFGGYIVHLGVVLIIVAIAASRAYTTQTSGTLDVGESITLGDYSVSFTGLSTGKEPHREWLGAKLDVRTTSGETRSFVPRMNFYERSNDPIGTPAVWTTPKEDLYISLMAFDHKANNASIKLWVFPMVGWIWWSIPLLALGTLIAIWPSRRVRVAAPASHAPAIDFDPPVSAGDVKQGAA